MSDIDNKAFIVLPIDGNFALFAVPVENDTLLIEPEAVLLKSSVNPKYFNVVSSAMLLRRSLEVVKTYMENLITLAEARQDRVLLAGLNVQMQMLGVALAASEKGMGAVGQEIFENLRKKGLHD